MPRVCMISGHLDLTQDEFQAHYEPLLRQAIANGDSFVVGDARGADTLAQWYLQLRALAAPVVVTVYHKGKRPRYNAGFATHGAFGSHAGKDAAMTRDSDYDILWIRPEKHSSVSGRVSGTEANLIRRKATGGRDA